MKHFNKFKTIIKLIIFINIIVLFFIFYSAEVNAANKSCFKYPDDCNAILCAQRSTYCPEKLGYFNMCVMHEAQKCPSNSLCGAGFTGEECVYVPICTVNLTANPSSGLAPLNTVVLTATVGGAKEGPWYYQFDCTNNGNFEVEGTAGALIDEVSTNACDYSDPGNYTARVKITRGDTSCVDTVPITVTSPILTCTISANPNSGTAPLNDVDLTVSVGGTATGNISYSLLCGNGQSYTTPSPISTNPYTKADFCDYSAGTYTVTVKVVRQSVEAFCYATVNVSEPPTLSCALTAIPSSGQAPLNDVDLSANVSGTATGSIVYKFDCTNNGTWEHTSSATTTDPYRINNLCDYATANIYTAKAQVTRGGLTAECPVTITVTNDAPNVPVLIAPPNNVWINYNPTFQATVSDLGDQVRAQFQVIGAATYIGNYVTGSGTSSTGPVVLTNSSNDFCFNNTWHARAQDISGLLSDWSTYWRVKVDKVAPETVAVSSPAIAVTTQIPVTLTEIDSCSGIQAGDVDVSINGGSWVNTGLPSGGAIINDFNYTGIDNNTYRFRYRVQDNAGNWSGYVYSVTTTVDINNPPVLGSLSRSASNQCMTAPYYTFVWTYSDADGDTGTLLEFQVDNNSDYSSPTINRSVNVNYVNGTVYNQTGILSTIATPDYLLFNTRYYWRARVSDEHGLFSAWVSGSSFLTSLHHYPMVDFINIPLKPNVNESTQFTDASICYDNVSTGSSCSDPNDSFKWIFLYGNPSTSTLENPIVEFTESGNQSVTLEVEDSDGFTCSLTKTLRINYALPKWKEIAPF